MDDLISRKAVVDTIYKRDERLQKCEIYRNKGDRIDLLGVLPEIHVIPPAFHGMTNGEVIQALFSDGQVISADSGVIEYATAQANIMVSRDFWNAPYQKEEK